MRAESGSDRIPRFAPTQNMLKSVFFFFSLLLPFLLNCLASWYWLERITRRAQHLSASSSCSFNTRNSLMLDTFPTLERLIGSKLSQYWEWRLMSGFFFILCFCRGFNSKSNFLEEKKCDFFFLKCYEYLQIFLHLDPTGKHRRFSIKAPNQVHLSFAFSLKKAALQK